MQRLSLRCSSMEGLQKLCEFKIHLRMPPNEVYGENFAELDQDSQRPLMNARLAT